MRRGDAAGLVIMARNFLYSLMLSRGNFYSNVLRERKLKTFDLINFPWPLSQGRYLPRVSRKPEVIQLFFKSLLLGKAKRSAEGQNGGSLLGLIHAAVGHPRASSEIAIGVERVGASIEC
jgi:hypothetical protein